MTHDDAYIDDFEEDDLHISMTPTITSSQPLRQSLDLFTTLDLANVNPTQCQTYSVMLDHHIQQVKNPVRHITEQKIPIRDGGSRDISTRERHDDMSHVAGTRALPTRPNTIDHRRIRSTVDNQLSHAVLSFLESAARRKKKQHQSHSHKSQRYAHVESRVRSMSGSHSTANIPISPVKRKTSVSSQGTPHVQRQNLTTETSTTTTSSRSTSESTQPSNSSPLRRPISSSSSSSNLSQIPMDRDRSLRERSSSSSSSLSQATIDKERMLRERQRMEILEEENTLLKQRIITLEIENEKLKTQMRERKKRDKVKQMMAEAAEKELQKEREENAQLKPKSQKSHKKSASAASVETTSTPQQYPQFLTMNKKMSHISLHIPTGTTPSVVPPISLPIPSHVSIAQSPPTPTAPPQPQAQPQPLQLQPPQQQPSRYNTSPMKSSSSTHSLPKHKPTRSDMMRTEVRRAAAEQIQIKEKERQYRDDERDRLMKARAKRKIKQQSMDSYTELLGHSSDNMDLLEISLYHEENRPSHIPKLSMDRAIAMITPRDHGETKENKEEYNEEFDEYEEPQEQHDEENELTTILSSTSSRISPSHQKSSISPSHARMKAPPSPSHAARCAVDGCHQTRTTRGYCSIHAAMHSPLTSPINKNKHVSNKSSTSSIPEDDDISLSSVTDSMEYDASMNITIHKPPPIMEGLKLDFSNMDLHQNRHLWAVDNVSDSFEITKSGTFKRGDFSLNKRGLSVRSHDAIENSTPRIPTIITEDTTTTRKRGGSKTKNFDIHPEDLVILNVLGRGSSGVVYRCFDLPTLSLIALKSISITEQDKRKQLSREIITLANDQSPYLIGFKGAYFDEGHIYMALEYMNHGSLQDWIDTHGALSEWSLAYIFERVLHGLAHLHSHQKVHRDIKPHNILINDHGEIKVADFGIMGQITESIDTCKTFVGTLIYMSPERLGGATYDYSCDIWSMGLAFLTCALGTYAIPHTGHFELITKIQNAAKLVDDLSSKYSRDLKSFVASCLNAEPSARPTAEQLLDHPFLVRFREGPTHEIPVPPEFAPSALLSARNSITNKDIFIRHKDPTQPETARRGSVTTNAVIAAHLGDATGTAAALARDKYDNTAKICEALVKRNYIQKTPETPDRKRANETLTQQHIRIIANQLEVPQQLVHTLYTEREKKYIGLGPSPLEV